MQPAIIDLNEAISDTSKMLERILGEHIQLTTTLNSKVGRVKTDPGQLSQIITNLAVNARDAMPHGGKLTIETDNVFLEPDYTSRHPGILPGAYVMLAVSDNGTGMNNTTKEHIFEPFFTTKEIGKGTGLGLATVYGIVKQSGGSIEVYSEEGIGTSFKVYLPRVAVQAEPERIKGLSAEWPKGTETILLVEDEDLVRHLSSQILEESGYTVIEARNGLHALEICEQENYKFDLLMTDVVMPQMGGRELAEKLKSKLPGIKLLFTSGYTDDAIVRHGIIETNTSFIQKPFSPEDLSNKIREILDNTR
jgi:CheY-like chemotaxis protein